MSRLVPKLRFDGFSGGIPPRMLKEVVVSNTYGPRFNANDYDINGNVKTIRGTDISFNGNILYNQVPIANLDINFIKSHILEDGDLVMITTADCGLTGIFEEQKDKYICSAYAVKITLNKTLASPYYFKYFFQTEFAKIEINKLIRKATVANLPASDILKITLKLPSKEEQQKIANCFSCLDNLIEAQNKKVEALKKHKKGLMQRLFSKGGERVPEFRFDGFFGDWEDKTLSKIGHIITGNTPKTNELDNYGDEILFVSPTDISENRYLYTTNKKLTAKGFLKTRPIKAQSILVVCIGSTIGKVAQSKFESATNQQINSIIPFNEYNNDFIYSTLEKDAKKIKGIAGNHAVPIINKTEFSSIKILVPSTKAEQQKIANTLSSLDSLIEVQNKKIEALKKHKKGLMQGLFVSSED